MRRLAAIIAALALLLPAGAALPAQASGHQVSHGSILSFDGTRIAFTVYRPAGVSATDRAPVILHSHGWSGSRTRSAGAFTAHLDAGFGVISFDQRGHGESGGQAHVQDPDYEARDVMVLIDHIATFDWVALDGPNDPVLGAIGGSYGGGYQLISALAETAATGRTRFNALAPEITWHDLPQSLAPNRVPRTVWDTVLYAVGATRLPQYVHEAFAWGTATGQWPDGSLGGPDLHTEFLQHSPRSFSDAGIRLDIPVLFGQGFTDTLFPVNEAWHNLEDALTPAARAKSLFVGYNGGHVLPSVLPAGTGSSGDACTSGFSGLAIDFFKAAFAGGDTAALQPATYNLTTAGGECVRVQSMAPTTTVDAGTIVTPTGAGAPLHVPLLAGPVTVAGIPQLSARLTTVGVDARAFVALSVGTSPTDAKVVQHNVMPVRSLEPVLGADLTTELAGVAVQVPDGQTLYLTVSPVSDLSIFHGSRVPGLLSMEDVKVALPVVG